MKTLNDLKLHNWKKALQTIPAIALLFCLGVPAAMAGATNRGDNTAATPGDKSSTTSTPSDSNIREDNIRQGTTNSTNSGVNKKSKSLNTNCDSTTNPSGTNDGKANNTSNGCNSTTGNSDSTSSGTGSTNSTGSKKPNGNTGEGSNKVK